MKQKILSLTIFLRRGAIPFALLVAMFFLFQSCNQEKKQSIEFTNKDINNVITKMTDIMVHDVTNPPLAARFFSYACLAGYEAVSQNDSSIKNMYGVLNDYPDQKTSNKKL